VLDGRAAGDADASRLFDDGTPIGDVDAGVRRTASLKLVIEAGTGDIILTPHLTAASGAILGLRALRLTRAATRADTAARPFYESDESEHAAEPLAPGPPKPTFAIVQPRELPPVAPPAPPAPAKVAPSAAEPVSSAPQPAAAVPPVTVAVPPVTPASAPLPRSVKRAASPAPATSPPALVAEPAAQAAPAKPAGKVRAVIAKPATPVAPSLAEVVSHLSVGSSASIAPSKPRAKAKPKAKGKAAAPLAAPAAGLTVRSERAIEPVRIQVVRSAEDAVAVEGRGGPVLTVSVDRKRLAALARLFGGASLGMIAHYLVLNALAAKDALPGDGADGSIAAFVAHQEQLLSRALITTRLGKTPQPESISAALPPLPPALATHADRPRIASGPPGEAVLVRAFTPGDIAYLQRSTANEQAAPFLRCAQLFIGLGANDAVVVDDVTRRDAEVALTAYAALATAEIGRIFLRGKLNRSPDLFKASDPEFDAAARTMLTTLGRLIA
jgi:hypothetical protein